MAGEFKPGAVLDWEKFQFEDGTTKDKLLIVLGAKQGHDVLLVLVTSQKHFRNFNPGCHAVAGYYHIPKGTVACFPKDTWVILKQPRVASAAELVKLGISKQIRVSHNLSQELTSALINCLKKGIDVSQVMIDLL